MTTGLPVIAFTTTAMEDDTAYELTKAFWTLREAMATERDLQNSADLFQAGQAALTLGARGRPEGTAKMYDPKYKMWAVSRCQAAPYAGFELT